MKALQIKICLTVKNWKKQQENVIVVQFSIKAINKFYKTF